MIHLAPVHALPIDPTFALRLALALPLFALAATSGCDRHQPATTSAATDLTAAGAKSVTPLAVVEAVHASRIVGEFDALADHLCCDQGDAVVELVRCVDRLESANRKLTDAVTRTLGRAAAKRFDRAQAGNVIGVFSRDVRVVDERIADRTATVSIQVGSRLPLQQVELIREGDRWRIRVDPPIPGVSEELCRLADALSETAGRLARSPMTEQQLADELALREAAVGRRITALTTPADE